MRELVIALGMVSLVGCTGELVSGDADGGIESDGGTDDGAIVDTGVTVEVVVLGANGQPASQAPIDFEAFSVSSVTVQLHDVRLIGDTAPSGNLVHPSSAVEFPQMGVARVSFTSAPPGLYSRVSFDVERTWANEDTPTGFEGERLAVRVVGELHLDNKTRGFEYVADSQVVIDLDFDKEVAPGRPGVVPVELNLREWFDAVDWAELDSRHNGNQPIQIGMGEEPELAGILLERLSDQAFEVRD